VGKFDGGHAKLETVDEEIEGEEQSGHEGG
jgi:hypothetical protein